ncbi:MAG: hypothetical protein EBR99_00050 [Actinobacteria bacterium]|nr:hypothetical protein [Actinomycetota bacterium]
MARNRKTVAQQARAFGWDEGRYIEVINQLGDRFIDLDVVRSRTLEDLIALRAERVQFLTTGLPALGLASADEKHLAQNARLNLTLLDKLITRAGGQPRS